MLQEYARLKTGSNSARGCMRFEGSIPRGPGG
jgi:hypothetical protein